MLKADAPWHRASYDRFIHQRLPELLAGRVPLGGYEAQAAGPHELRLRITLAAKAEQFALEMTAPAPDELGVFKIGERSYVCLPIASSEELDQAQIDCVGEQLYEQVEKRIGEAPADLAWDRQLAAAWLPLDVWMRDFIRMQQPWGEAGSAGPSNWLSRIEHLRRIVVRDRKNVFVRSQIGRTCPFATPEGPNVGRVLAVAVGAEIRDGKLVVVDSRPEATLSVAASMVPFLEHNDPTRQLMGVNMMRQWVPAEQSEPALVQTGNEPADAPEFWCGQNLLTAFTSRGLDTHEDAIVVSRSAARRLAQGGELRVGDKLSNRHGTKGTISRIVPDEEMPHISDGTAVDLVFCFVGLHTRLNFGQVREAVMGRIARAEGRPAVVPPFAAPGAEELQRRLEAMGMDRNGMDLLRDGKSGPAMQMPSTVGYVYWGKTHHLALEKVCAGVRPAESSMMQGEFEYLALREAGAVQIIAEHYNTRARERKDSTTLADRLAEGAVQQADAPTPRFAEVVRRLEAGGIRAQLGGGKLGFGFERPGGEAVRLARALKHPWDSGRMIEEIGVVEGVPELGRVIEMNQRLARMSSAAAPGAMLDQAVGQLEQAVRTFFDELLAPEDLKLKAKVLFSGKAVLSPSDLAIDQIGIPQEIAWTLFGPHAAREVGGGAVARREAPAAAVLDRVMSQSWIIVTRAPALTPMALLAFRPVRIDDPVIRLHPLGDMPLNSDHDGDQVGVFLPITQAGQREAGEKLSFAGYLQRDPSLLRLLLPPHASMWGLAWLSLTPAGKAEIDATVGAAVAAPEGFVTSASLRAAAAGILEQQGPQHTLGILDALMRLGFEAARRSGASLAPFADQGLDLPTAPANGEPDEWQAYMDEITAQLTSMNDFANPVRGPQLLLVRSGARGRMRHLAQLLGMWGVFDLDGKPYVARRSAAAGAPFDELMARAITARRAIARIEQDMVGSMLAAYAMKQPARGSGMGVLARAMRAPRPGVVFARAAATGETDPLTDVDSRLLVGV